MDLTQPDEQPMGLPAEVAKAVERLNFYKNNGFGDRFGKEQAHRILQSLQQAGALERDVVLGAQAARGAFDRALRNLAKLIDGLTH